MTSINLLKVASLPGSGSGCQSALPAEVGKAAGKAPDPLDAWFQPGEVAFVTGLNEGRDFAAGYTKQDAEESLSFYFDLAKGEKFLFRFKDWEGGPDLLDAAGGGE